MLLLGLDIGTSSVKASVFDAHTGQTVTNVQYPETETGVISPQPGFAEQSPLQWWSDAQQAILKANATGKYNPKEIAAIGIAYQMHGLVAVDDQKHVLRNSIIWSDSRAVEIGNKAFDTIGHKKSLSHLLNSPGNFTASKLAWIKAHEPQVYERIAKIMLPGDYINMKLTGEINTSVSALSEGVFWDFKNESLSADVLNYFGFDSALIPEIQEVFTPHGQLQKTVAEELGLSTGIPVTYKAGDQPNNALALNVLQPGEVAATAGTSGVVYAVSDQLVYDQQSRINSFAHVNHTTQQQRIGVLLNINGCGIMNSWIKKLTGGQHITYQQMNDAAATVEAGSNGLSVYPFGNGAERIFNNRIIGAHFKNLDLNIHGTAHIYRAIQESIVFALRYGIDIMRENGIAPKIIRAGSSNMFLSEVFNRVFVNTTQVPVELHKNDGSTGAAIGAGIGLGILNEANAFKNTKPITVIEPEQDNRYEDLYAFWKAGLPV